VTTCIVRLEKGICGQPKVGEVEIRLMPHDFIYYVKYVELQRVPVCRSHLELFNGGWSLQASMVFRWVPPR